ncbi:MAG: histidine triad nucleotide-binding protein [Candidatus Hydrogenedens sp.]|nr:histidine triad nucleotide-binding protein [Candidatus Hydrogenedentota bacterium]NLF57470.1 histidine triad nucleotide-binding protein [Candidatus Hydrogenedens sp.]
MAEDTIFGKIIRGEIPCDKVYEDDAYLAFRDIHPAAPVHVLVIPKKPIPTLNDAGEADAALLGGLLLCAARVARILGVGETGYRTVINCGREAGQEVFHLHLHLLGGRGMSWPPG